MENNKSLIKRMVASGIIVDGCAACEVFFRNPHAVAPLHKPSSNCQSGSLPHCTCRHCSGVKRT